MARGEQQSSMLRSSDGKSPGRPHRGAWWLLGSSLALLGLLGWLGFEISYPGLRMGNTRIFAPWFRGKIAVTPTVELEIDRASAIYGRQRNSYLVPKFASMVMLVLTKKLLFRVNGYTSNGSQMRMAVLPLQQPFVGFGVTVNWPCGFYFVSVDPAAP